MNATCGSLNVIDSYNLIENVTILTCGFVEVGIYVGNVSLWGWALRFPMIKILPSVLVHFLLVHLLLSSDKDVASTVSVLLLSCCSL